MCGTFAWSVVPCTRLLEGLGKAKATQDDVFDQHAANLSKQSKACERLYRDLKAYGTALKTMVQAQKTLRETIRELYEPDWPDREHLCAITQTLDLQWDEFEKIVNEQVMGSVNSYMTQFSDLKAKVAKRGRKLVDFDSARNNYATVKASSKKGDEDPKVVKALADLQQAETMYRDINRELVDALPATYDSRITFFNNKTLVTLLDNLGNSFESLRVPRISTDHSVSPVPSSEKLAQNEVLPRPRSEIPTPAPRQTSPRGSTVSLPLKAEAQDEESVEKKMYPVS
ncbi:unnamed protein product [Gongylonema pulchrum]|uniref:BAR domain-containing protein n=1 Tax=Gongylonema pulchrum TaxID=637853 RepID=A0A3P7MI71_9BILA|nr:unnamed protein product [Gongylonema pulchrum]